jgi:hypothetical protein
MRDQMELVWMMLIVLVVCVINGIGQACFAAYQMRARHVARLVARETPLGPAD